MVQLSPLMYPSSFGNYVPIFVISLHHQFFFIIVLMNFQSVSRRPIPLWSINPLGRSKIFPHVRFLGRVTPQKYPSKDFQHYSMDFSVISPQIFYFILTHIPLVNLVFRFSTLSSSFQIFPCITLQVCRNKLPIPKVFRLDFLMVLNFYPFSIPEIQTQYICR